jgi:hypothetical protein
LSRDDAMASEIGESADVVAKIVRSRPVTRDIAQRIVCRSFLNDTLSRRGIAFPFQPALLKLSEILRLPSIDLSAAEVQHGPRAALVR